MLHQTTFAHVAAVNKSRSEAWHKDGATEWNVSDWAVAMAGEAGEVCDAVKKLRRLECNLATKRAKTREQRVEDIADEIGDTFLYLDLLAQHLGLTLEDCVKNKFNKVSERENLPHRL